MGTGEGDIKLIRGTGVVAGAHLRHGKSRSSFSEAVADWQCPCGLVLRANRI